MAAQASIQSGRRIDVVIEDGQTGARFRIAVYPAAIRVRSRAITRGLALCQFHRTILADVVETRTSSTGQVLAAKPVEQRLEQIAAIPWGTMP